MTPALIAAVGVVLGAPNRHVALLVGAVVAPVMSLAVVLVLAARAAFESARTVPADPAVGTIVSVAGELRAGRTLRAVAADGHFGTGLASRARHGLALQTVRVAELEGFGNQATTIVATLALAAHSGAAVAHVFERLAADLIEDDRTRRDRRAAMAPVIAQATIVGGLPLVALAQMVVSGRWLEMASRGSAEAATIVVGTVAVLLGVLWIGQLVHGRNRG